MRINSFLIFFLFLSTVVSAQFKLYEKGHDSYTAGKYNDAIKNFSEYLTKSTRDKALDADVYYLRGLSYYKTNVYQKAITDFEESILLNHDNKGNIYWFKAKCHEKLGENEEALNAYTSALRELDARQDSKVKLLYDRSQVYTKTGNLVKAYEDLFIAAAIDPSNADVKKELTKLESQGIASRSTVAKKQEPAKQENTTQGGTNQGGAKQNTVAKQDVTKKDAGQQKPTQTVAKQETKKTNEAIPVENSTVKKDEDVEKKDTKLNKLFAKAEPKTNATATKEEANKTTQQNQVKAQTTPVVEQTQAAPTLADLYRDERRYALIIGNSAYPKTIGVLKNPVNDATDIAKELQNSGFDVDLLTNATYGQMRAALLKFKEKVDAGDKEKTVALFYFAGHGVQHEDENYLVPIDATVQYEDDIPRYCFPTQRMVLANMERSNSRMNIVILDACRNNPFPALNRSVSQGLGEMKRARGSFIAYATAPGSVASDGTGRNGLYTQELLKSMRKPGLTIEQVFKDVRANVLKLSGDRQNTWDSSNIIGEFYFKLK